MNEFLKFLGLFGGVFSLDKDPNNPVWVASCHWFPTEVKMPFAQLAASGTASTPEEAMNNLFSDMQEKAMQASEGTLGGE